MSVQLDVSLSKSVKLSKAPYGNVAWPVITPRLCQKLFGETLGQVTMSRDVPRGGRAVFYNRLWMCCITWNLVVQGLWGAFCWGGSLINYDIPSAASHMNVLWGWGFTAGPVCIREDGWSLPLTRGYTWNLLPRPCFRELGRESV